MHSVQELSALDFARSSLLHEGFSKRVVAGDQKLVSLAEPFEKPEAPMQSISCLTWSARRPAAILPDQSAPWRELRPSADIPRSLPRSRLLSITVWTGRTLEAILALRLFHWLEILVTGLPKQERELASEVLEGHDLLFREVATVVVDLY